MSKKVFNMQGGMHSAAAYSALENRLYGGAKATVASFVVSAGSGMNASISTGDGLISVDAESAKRIQTTAAETALVPTASASFNRIDSLVAYIDTAVTVNPAFVDNTNDVLKFVVVAGTAASTPLAPTGAAIQSAIGAGKPYLVIADITVPQNAVNLSGATFTNRAPIIQNTSGWTLANEAWSYASWSSGTRTGVITVPSGATTRYTAGMRIKIEQSTGGVKYGIITAVASTTLTVFFPTGTTLNNETIFYPSVSSIKVPLGFNVDPTVWKLRVDINEQATRAAGAYLNPSGAQLVVPVGAWHLVLHFIQAQDNTTADGQFTLAGLSTTNNSFTDNELKVGMYQRAATTSGQETPTHLEVDKLYASQTTYFVNVVSAQVGGSTTIGVLSGYNGNSYAEAICNYL